MLLWCSLFVKDCADWLLDPAKARIGRDNVPLVAELLDSLSVYHFAARLGPDWTFVQVQTLMNMVRAELQDVSLKLYIPM
jgi:hypothetical protein